MNATFSLPLVIFFVTFIIPLPILLPCSLSPSPWFLPLTLFPFPRYYCNFRFHYRGYQGFTAVLIPMQLSSLCLLGCTLFGIRNIVIWYLPILPRFFRTTLCIVQLCCCAVFVCTFIYPSVCHIRVLYWNEQTYRQTFSQYGSPTIPFGSISNVMSEVNNEFSASWFACFDCCVLQVNDRRYLFCPASMTIGHLKRFLICKLDLPPSIKVCL